MIEPRCKRFPSTAPLSQQQNKHLRESTIHHEQTAVVYSPCPHNPSPAIYSLGRTLTHNGHMRLTSPSPRINEPSNGTWTEIPRHSNGTFI